MREKIGNSNLCSYEPYEQFSPRTVSKVAFFFISRDKFRGHSLTQNWQKCFFFSRKSGKKKTNVFYFFPGIVCEPLTRSFLRLLFFLKRKSCLVCFFFPPTFGRIFVFFFLEKFTFTHSLDWKARFFFPGPEKKKRVFHSLTRFLPKNPKKQTIPWKKKTLPLLRPVIRM